MKEKLLNLLEEKGVETPENWEYLMPKDLTPPLKLESWLPLESWWKKENYHKVQSSLYFSWTNIYLKAHYQSSTPSSCLVDRTKYCQKF